MKVDIDLVADALSVQWAPRARAASQIVGRPGRPGVRVHFNEAGDVVGFEALGWSRRTEDPTGVEVVVHAGDSVETLAGDHPLARALAGTNLETDADHRPMHDGAPMITLAEAARMVGRERSWLSREMGAGRLQALKIGRTWWTSPDWVERYINGRHRDQRKRPATR
jgi:hypothetical protein